MLDAWRFFDCDAQCMVRQARSYATAQSLPVGRNTHYAIRSALYTNPAAFFNAATLSNRSHGASMSVRPKWPYAAVAL